jgi:hypothetical protein
MMSLFPRRSVSGFEVVRERYEAQIRADAAEALVSKFLAAYVAESLRPDCLPEFRFRVTLPNGVAAYRGTRDEAERLLRDTVAGA